MDVNTDHNRQIAESLEGIADDHVVRYLWAASWMKEHGGIKTVLDGACGCGYGSQILAEAGFTVAGIDVSDEAIGWGEKYYAHENVSYDCKDLLKIDTEFTRVDAVVSFETLEHLENAPGLVGIFRKISPIILCSTPNEEKYNFKETKPLGHVRHYSPAEFDYLMRGSRTLAACTQKSKAEHAIVKGRDGRYLVQARAWWDWDLVSTPVSDAS